MNSHWISIQTRSYQQEMFQRSMQGNTIVVMDTGSGKTHVAILRIQAALDRCRSDQRVWFLAPTVELCIQQHREVSNALPAYQHRLLTGSDNVDRWSEARIWDAALDQHQVVVSTHAVLADALSHGFVQIHSLALLVFDEAHHCTKKHPANIIMKNFYHPSKAVHGPSSVPHILGLSASLITRSKIKSMQEIESNLDSISVTPRVHREELLHHVHRPTCHVLIYESSCSLPDRVAPNICELRALQDRLRLAPVLQRMSLQSVADTTDGNGTESYSAKQQQALVDAVKTFYTRAENIYDSLGLWAADHFVHETVQALENGIDGFHDPFNRPVANRRSLLNLFDRLRRQSVTDGGLDPRDDNISPKVRRLISFLLEENEDNSVSIVFVHTRATTSVLAELLNRHPMTKDKFRCVPFVGTSNTSNRSCGLAELVDLKAQKQTLAKFRAGEHNLIVATNALEEGIDVQSCNVVVGFDPPANVKSFIQQRGRARHIRSRLGILLSADKDDAIINRWQSLEQELSQICQSDRTRTSLASALESVDEEVNYELAVSSTGARLGVDATLSHLHHFCNKLPHRPYVDFSPIFAYKEDESGLIEATVTLPNCLSASVRHATSRERWNTERAAKKDAAFQAYLGLYQAGLLSDNLLPLSHDWDPESNEDSDDSQTGSIDISPQIDIWYEMGCDQGDLKWHETALTIFPPQAFRDDGEMDVKLLLTTPGPLCAVPQLLLNWKSERTFVVKVGRSIPITQPSSYDLELLRNATRLLYASVRSERLAGSDENFITLFAPYLKFYDLSEWLRIHSQRCRASKILGTSPSSLVRVPYPQNPPYIFYRWLRSEDGDMVQCERLPRRRNFRSPVVTTSIRNPLLSSNQPEERRLETFPANECTFDGLPLSMARTGLFMHEILQHVEDFTILDRIQSDLLKDIQFKNREHILTAICAPSAKRQNNYQRFEFIGDSVLKFVVSCHLFVSQPDWHEGLLTQKRSQFVSNSNLAGAAIRNDLSSYMITEGISYKDWAVPVFHSIEHVRKNRHVSYKRLADVVEALIGAAWLDSGISSARKCINLFLPAIPVADIDLETPTSPEQIPFATADEVEHLIKYRFTNRTLLLEALTHPSCGGYSQTDSYQRLEYLGDAVLDVLIARQMGARIDHLSQGRMTQIRAALVNARLLGFFCLNLRHFSTHRAVCPDFEGRTTLITGTREVHLAEYMRFVSPELSAARHANERRYNLHNEGIRLQLNEGKQYPWAELLQLRPDKYYSDIIESLLGAIFVDTNGNLNECAAFTKRLGLQTYANRLIEEEVDVSHPRDRLQHRAGGRTVEYPVQRNMVDGTYECTLLLDEVKIAEVNGCCDREEARTQVATKVEKMLSSGEMVW